MRSLKNVCNLILGMGLAVIAAASQAATTVIDVMAVYTKGAADAYQGSPETRINHLFQITNQIYADSGLDVEIRLVKTMMVDYTDDNAGDEALRDITFAQHKAFADVERVRDQVKADMVILYRPFKSTQGGCGQAWVVGEGSNGDFSGSEHKKYMYSQIPLNSCGDYATAHELGHNMGLRHSRRQDGSGGVFPFALGHGVDNEFATIMAYQSSFNADYWSGKVYKFSSPDLECNGRSCGVDRNDTANGADARYAISITAPQIAAFYYEASSAISESSSSVSSVSSSSSSLVSSFSSSSSSLVSSSLASSSSSSPVIIADSKPAASTGGAGGGGSVGIIFIAFGFIVSLFRINQN